MWAPRLLRGTCRHPSLKQTGTTAVEFALLVGVFLTFVLGIMEVARILFVYNTLQEVTRRASAAATNIYPTDPAIADAKRYAVFRDSPGELVLARPVTDASVRFTYLSYDLSVIPPSSWPADATSNRQICMINPHASNCIRFIQTQVCAADTTDSCESAQSEMMIPLVNLRVRLPKATTIVPVGTLGYVPGTAPPCACT